MTDTSLIPKVGDPDLEDDDPIVGHIVYKAAGDKRSLDAIILEARVMGIPLEALCGKVFVPSRDPMKYPVCSRCVEILKEMPT